MSRATIICESGRVEHRIGVDLVAGRSQKATAIIVTQVVALRGNRASGVDDVGAACAGLENVIAELQPHRASAAVRDVNTAATGAGGVLAESTTADAQHCVAVLAVDVNGAAITTRRVLAEGRIGNAACGAARKGIVLNSASVEAG